MSKRAWAGGGVFVVAVVAVALVAVLVTAASGQDSAPAGEPPHTITVSSSATISATPDEAVITFSVHTENADSTVALNENSRIMNDLIAAMKSVDITQRDMETTNINLSQQTIDRGTSSESTVFKSSTSLEVKVHDDVIGSAIQKGVQAGATSARGVRFQVSDPAEVKKRALKAAVESALAKADALAGAAGTSVTGVIQISEGGSPAVPQPYLVRSQTLTYAATDADLSVVPPRGIQTKVSVSVIWSID